MIRASTSFALRVFLWFALASAVVFFPWACASFRSGPLTEGSGLRTGPPAAAEQITDMQGLINAVTQINTELAAIKAGRDSFAGLTYQSTLPAGLAVLLGWQSWLSHRRAMARYGKGLP